MTEINGWCFYVFSCIVNRLSNGIQHHDPEKLSRWYMLPELELSARPKSRGLRLGLQGSCRSMAGRKNVEMAGGCPRKHCNRPRNRKRSDCFFGSHSAKWRTNISSAMHQATPALARSQFRANVADIVNLLEPMHPLIKVQQFVA